MDQKKVFFCYKCNELYYSSNAAKCPKCKENLTGLEVAADKWETMSDDEINEVLRKHMPTAPAKKDSTEKKAPPKTETSSGSNAVRFCLSCEKAFTDGETVCPRCKGPLVRTHYSQLYWKQCAEMQKKQHIKEYIEKGDDNPATVTTVPQNKENETEADTSSAAVWVKNISIIYIIVSVIGALIIMSQLDELGKPLGFAIILVSFVFGLVAYGVGEICEQVTQINRKLKKEE